MAMIMLFICRAAEVLGQCGGGTVVPPPDPSVPKFGGGIGVSGEWLACTSQYRSDGVLGPAIFMYRRDGNAWAFDSQLLSVEPGSPSQLDRLAISGGIVAAGDTNASSELGDRHGAVETFELSGNTWQSAARLVPENAVDNDYFGYAVAIDGQTLVASSLGARRHGMTGAGAAYVFEKIDGQWANRGELEPPVVQYFGQFGNAVAISGDTAVVSSSMFDGPAGLNQGAVYVFVRVDGLWSLQATLYDPVPAASENFGLKVALHGDVLVVGSREDRVDGLRRGSAWIFERTGSSWNLTATLEPVGGAVHSEFGYSVATDGHRVVVGELHPGRDMSTIQGFAHVYIKSGTGWWHEVRLMGAALPRGVEFGRVVNIEGDGAFVCTGGFNPATPSVFAFARGEMGWDVAPPLQQDLNDDLAVGLPDLAVIIDRWGTTVSPGDWPDVNGDGTIGLGDVASVVGAWGVQCE
ncbi:MAG TPA: hypothetical protein VG797_07985 [Phycisphaerales bacterium]|nr:hypothetical protein [Phycisphaerales bacterium]